MDPHDLNVPREGETKTLQLPSQPKLQKTSIAQLILESCKLGNKWNSCGHLSSQARSRINVAKTRGRQPQHTAALSCRPRACTTLLDGRLICGCSLALKLLKFLAWEAALKGIYSPCVLPCVLPYVAIDWMQPGTLMDCSIAYFRHPLNKRWFHEAPWWPMPKKQSPWRPSFFTLSILPGSIGAIKRARRRRPGSRKHWRDMKRS